MAGPATKFGSMTAHGGTVIGPGCPTVLINKVPAIRIGADMHLCPMVTPGVPPIPHVGMNNIGPGVPNVLIGKMPASTVGDNFLCVGPPAPVVTGAFNVLIGTGGGGGVGGGGGGGAGSSSIQALKAGAVKPVKGTETFPVKIQAALLECQPAMAPESFEQLMQAIAQIYNEAGTPPEEDELSIADIVEILEGIESDEGYEAARFFASHLDLGTLTELTRAYISGEDANPDNDPNIMPTRFMILYGADDGKLRRIDEHPDVADGESQRICVENLRKALKLLGYDVAESGPYDDKVYVAHIRYLATLMGEYLLGNIDELEDGDTASSDQCNEQSVEELTISLNVKQDNPKTRNDKVILYSNDIGRSYFQEKIIKDDAQLSNDTLDLVFAGLNPNLNYTLEYDPSSSGKTEIVFRNRPFGKWFA